MKQIYYTLSDFHKAVKRDKPKTVYSYQLDVWFYTQKAILVYRPNDYNDRKVMLDWLVKQNVEVIYESER